MTRAETAGDATTQEAGRIEWLDGWRTVAVVVVIVSHWSRLHFPDSEFPGKAGVFLFFGISGFIVTKLLLREKRRAGRIDFRAFYIRRALRILPPLALYTLVCAALFWGDVGNQVSAARAITFTCNITPAGAQDCNWIFGHTWSLAFEEQFYLLLPAVLAFPALWSGRLMLGAALVLAALPFVMPMNYVGQVGFVQIYLLLGGGAFLAWREETLMPRLARVPPALSLLLLACAAGWMQLEPSLVQKATGLLVPGAVLVGMFALPMASPRARALLASRPMATVGLWSYTLYLWQQLALADFAWSTGWTQAAAMLAAVAFSALSFRYFETPFRDLGRRLSGPRASAQPAA